ncbi:MAG: hypothetical protein ACT4QG_02395 [Sporichthyaceae bacterium]
MTVHAFVDESKVRGLLLVAAVIAPRDLAASRRAMTELCMPGQYRVHFAKERRSRRSQILDVVCDLDVQLDIVDATSIRIQKTARHAGLNALVGVLAAGDCRRLVLEQDDSLVDFDRTILYAAVHGAGFAQQFSYEHLPARSESLLWIPDAAAWCWTAGGHWRDRIRPMVRNVVTL